MFKSSITKKEFIDPVDLSKNDLFKNLVEQHNKLAVSIAEDRLRYNRELDLIRADYNRLNERFNRLLNHLELYEQHIPHTPATVKLVKCALVSGD